GRAMRCFDATVGVQGLRCRILHPATASRLFRERIPGGTPMRRRFEARTVIVTGASSGIGESAARMFAREGANVVLAARTAPALEHLASEIAAAGGVAMAVPTDAADAPACAILFEAPQAKFGAVHVLVNNPGSNF